MNDRTDQAPLLVNRTVVRVAALMWPGPRPSELSWDSLNQRNVLLGLVEKDRSLHPVHLSRRSAY